MKQKSAEAILSASKPRDIFTMNANTLEQEKEEYLEAFKPQQYNTIKNFMVTQNVILLYRQALSEISEFDSSDETKYFFTIRSSDGKTYEVNAHYVYDIKLGKMYVTENKVIFIIPPKNRIYYENYIEKTRRFPKFNKDIWEPIEHMVPKVYKHFEDEEGNGVIVVNKPCSHIYPLREILNYFEGKIAPEYVASMLTRLYNFVCYLELVGINHNGITIDNLFFAPGKTVNEGESYTVEDMRIVGVFGGWFFSTRPDEKLKGVPKEIYEILPVEVKTSGYSSFEVDELSIKMIARELLGDSTGENIEGVPESFVHWLNNCNIHKNAYEEFCAWESARRLSFGKHRFVEMDVSID